MLSLSVRLPFCLFQTYTNDTCWVCKSRTGEARSHKTGRVKLKFSPGTGEAKFSLGEGKKFTGSGFNGSFTEGRVYQTSDVG